MTPSEHAIVTIGPRSLVITNDPLEFGNVEAWINILRSYQAAYPGHAVTLLYEGEPVAQLESLFRKARELDREAFALLVKAPQAERKAVAKLFRLLVEGAGPHYRPFLSREVNQLLKLF